MEFPAMFENTGGYQSFHGVFYRFPVQMAVFVLAGNPPEKIQQWDFNGKIIELGWIFQQQATFDDIGPEGKSLWYSIILGQSPYVFPYLARILLEDIGSSFFTYRNVFQISPMFFPLILEVKSFIFRQKNNWGNWTVSAWVVCPSWNSRVACMA